MPTLPPFTQCCPHTHAVRFRSRAWPLCSCVSPIPMPHGPMAHSYLLQAVKAFLLPPCSSKTPGSACTTALAHSLTPPSFPSPGPPCSPGPQNPSLKLCYCFLRQVLPIPTFSRHHVSVLPEPCPRGYMGCAGDQLGAARTAHYVDEDVHLEVAMSGRHKEGGLWNGRGRRMASCSWVSEDTDIAQSYNSMRVASRLVGCSLPSSFHCLS